MLVIAIFVLRAPLSVERILPPTTGMAVRLPAHSSLEEAATWSGWEKWKDELAVIDSVQRTLAPAAIAERWLVLENGPACTVVLNLERKVAAELVENLTPWRRFRRFPLYQVEIAGRPAVYIGAYRNLLILALQPFQVEKILDQVRIAVRPWQRIWPVAEQLERDTTLGFWWQPAELVGTLAPTLGEEAGDWLTRQATTAKWAGLSVDHLSDTLWRWHGRLLPQRPFLRPAPGADAWSLPPPTIAGAFPIGRIDADEITPDFKRYIAAWWTGEGLRLHWEAGDRQAVWILLSSDDSLAGEHMEKLMRERGGLLQADDPITTYYHLADAPAFAPFLGGESASVWATPLRGAWLVARERAALSRFLDYHLAGASLAATPEFARALTLLGEAPAASWLLYFSPPAWQQWLAAELAGWQPPGLANGFGTALVRLQARGSYWDMEGVAWAPRSDAAAYELAWRHSLEGGVGRDGVREVRRLDGRPADMVAIQESSQWLTLLDATGAVRWRKHLDGKLLSDVYQLDFFGQGSDQYLFNTDRRLYLLDEDGTEREFFPNLSGPAATALSVFDFARTGRSAVFLPTAAGPVYAYNADGQPLTGWTPLDLPQPLRRPIRHLQLPDRDLLILFDRLGVLRVFGRQAQARFALAPAAAPLVGEIGVEAPNEWNPGRIVFCDQNGRVTVVGLDGTPFPLRVTDGSAPVDDFLFHHLWGDGRRDYIVRQGRRLSLHAYVDNEFDQRWQTEFPRSVDTIYTLGPRWIGATDFQTGLLYAIDGEGKAVTGFPLAGRSMAQLLDGPNGPLLVVGYGREVLAYEVE